MELEKKQNLGESRGRGLEKVHESNETRFDVSDDDVSRIEGENRETEETRGLASIIRFWFGPFAPWPFWPLLCHNNLQ